MIHRHTFGDKLRFIHEDPVSKNGYSSIDIVINFGSIHEPPHLRGVAHIIEHMCFKGNKKIRTPKKLLDALTQMGVYSNAYTEKEYTLFEFQTPNENLVKTIEIALNMIFCSIFDETEFKKEYNVVIEENLK